MRLPGWSVMLSHVESIAAASVGNFGRERVEYHVHHNPCSIPGSCLVVLGGVIQDATSSIRRWQVSQTLQRELSTATIQYTE